MKNNIKDEQQSVLKGSEPGNVIHQRVDVVLRQRLRGGRHVAVKIGASLSLEATQLHFQVLELLTGETRDVLLTQQRLAVAGPLEHGPGLVDWPQSHDSVAVSGRLLTAVSGSL